MKNEQEANKFKQRKSINKGKNDEKWTDPISSRFTSEMKIKQQIYYAIGIASVMACCLIVYFSIFAIVVFHAIIVLKPQGNDLIDLQAGLARHLYCVSASFLILICQVVIFFSFRRIISDKKEANVEPAGEP